MNILNLTPHTPDERATTNDQFLVILEILHRQKKREPEVRVENYHQREDGGNMKKPFNCT